MALSLAKCDNQIDSIVMGDKPLHKIASMILVCTNEYERENTSLPQNAC